MPVYSKIGTKLLGSFLLVAALSVFLTGYFSFTSAKESLKKQLYNNLDLTVEDKEVKVLDFIANTKKEVVDIATNQALINIFKNNHTVSASNANDSIAEYLRKAKSTFYEIDVLDNNGNVISSTNTKAVKENRLKESFFSLSNNFGKNEAYISDVYLANDKIPTILTASNIIDKDSDEKLGKVVGYKSAIFLDAALSEFALEKNYSIGDISNSGNFETYLINRTGYLIVETSFARGKILEQQSVTKAFSSCQYGERIIDEYKDYRNVDVVGASKCLKNGWTLVSELSVDDAYSSLEIIKIKILLASLAIVVFVFIMVYFLIKKITDPIKNLIQVVKNIGQGDYSKKADTKEEGEMGMLAESFNLMTDNIIKTNKSIQEQNSQLKEASEELEGAKNSLEAKVKKRTLELEESKVYLEQKVEERTVELKKLNNKLETEVSNRTKELKEKLVELERFNKLAVGRELKMIELKEELKRNKKVPSHRKLT
ncbi:MAG: HAMP domain-containing protein [Candidatus Falkowbacteria bacterium]|nr:HAMP domain-containing protein [Candidatus Falkowbacteria bacterium]